MTIAAAPIAKLPVAASPQEAAPAAIVLAIGRGLLDSVLLMPRRLIR